MRRFIIVGLVLNFLFAVALGVFGQAVVNPTYTFTDFQLTPQAVRRITQTPLQAFADYGGAILSAAPSSQVTGGAGSATFSNTVPGYAYRIQLDTPFGSTVRTCGYPVTVSGNVNGRDFLGDIKGMTFYYLYPNSTNAIALSAISTNGAAPGQVLSWPGGATLAWTNMASLGFTPVNILTNGFSFAVAGSNNFTLSAGFSFIGDGSQLTGLAAANLTGTIAAGRMPALTGDVTASAGSTVTTLAAGNAGNLNSGTLLAARMPALTGDVTASAGSTATTLASGNAANLNSGTLNAARLPALTGDITSSAGSAATTLATGNAANLNSGTLLAARMPALTGAITTSAGAVATSLGSFTSANLSGALTDETGTGASVFQDSPTFTTKIIVPHISSTTNQATMAPNFLLDYEFISTNAAFAMLPPINVDANRAETTVMLYTNTTGVAFPITAPANCHVVGSGAANVTNLTMATVFHYGVGYTSVCFFPQF